MGVDLEAAKEAIAKYGTVFFDVVLRPLKPEFNSLWFEYEERDGRLHQASLVYYIGTEEAQRQVGDHWESYDAPVVLPAGNRPEDDEPRQPRGVVLIYRSQ